MQTHDVRYSLSHINSLAIKKNRKIKKQFIVLEKRWIDIINYIQNMNFAIHIVESSNFILILTSIILYNKLLKFFAYLKLPYSKDYAKNIIALNLKALQ